MSINAIDRWVVCDAPLHDLGRCARWDQRFFFGV